MTEFSRTITTAEISKLNSAIQPNTGTFTAAVIEKMSAIAPLDFINAEVAVFPKGHGAIATSWSKPDSPCPLDGEFNGFRGPVKFHLDMEEKLDSLISRNAA